MDSYLINKRACVFVWPISGQETKAYWISMVCHNYTVYLGPHIKAHLCVFRILVVCLLSSSVHHHLWLTDAIMPRQCRQGDYCQFDSWELQASSQTGVNNQNLVVQHLHLLVDVWIASSQRSLEVCFQRITRLPTYTSDFLLKICQPPKATIRPKRWWLLQNWSSYFNSLNHSTNGLWKDRRSFSMSFEWLQRWLPWCGIFRNNFKIFTDLCLAIVIFLF